MLPSMEQLIEKLIHLNGSEAMTCSGRLEEDHVGQIHQSQESDNKAADTQQNKCKMHK